MENTAVNKNKPTDTVQYNYKNWRSRFLSVRIVREHVPSSMNETYSYSLFMASCPLASHRRGEQYSPHKYVFDTTGLAVFFTLNFR